MIKVRHESICVWVHRHLRLLGVVRRHSKLVSLRTLPEMLWLLHFKTLKASRA
jgi:hypothetical protein